MSNSHDPRRSTELGLNPFSAHTQAMAYLTGAIAGDKIAKEYGWDDVS